MQSSFLKNVVILEYVLLICLFDNKRKTKRSIKGRSTIISLSRKMEKEGFGGKNLQSKGSPQKC